MFEFPIFNFIYSQRCYEEENSSNTNSLNLQFQSLLKFCKTLNVSISSATWRLNSRHIGSNDYAHLAGAKRLLKRDERKILTMIESVIYDRKLGSLPILDCLKIGNILVNRFIRIERIAFSLSLSRANPAPSKGKGQRRIVVWEKRRCNWWKSWWRILRIGAIRARKRL